MRLPDGCSRCCAWWPAGSLLTGLPGHGVRRSSTDGPDFEMPFACGDTWTGSSRSSHSPSYYSIDWNRADDLGALMVAAAPGMVTSVVDLGSRSYGRYVVVDHGDGWTTLYAHLLSQWVIGIFSSSFFTFISASCRAAWSLVSSSFFSFCSSPWILVCSAVRVRAVRPGRWSAPFGSR